MKYSSKSLQEPIHSSYLNEEARRYYDSATKQKINKHLNDINDVITDEDIRNVDTNLTKKILSPQNKA